MHEHHSTVHHDLFTGNDSSTSLCCVEFKPRDIEKLTSSILVRAGGASTMLRGLSSFPRTPDDLKDERTPFSANKTTAFSVSLRKDHCVERWSQVWCCLAWKATGVVEVVLP